MTTTAIGGVLASYSQNPPYSLPNEITTLFFQYFNARELIVSARVCKTWKQLIHTNSELKGIIFSQFCKFASIPNSFFPKTLQKHNVPTPKEKDEVLFMLQRGVYEKDDLLIKKGREGLKALSLTKDQVKEVLITLSLNISSLWLVYDLADEFSVDERWLMVNICFPLTQMEGESKLKKRVSKLSLESSLQIAIRLKLHRIFQLAITRFIEADRLDKALQMLNQVELKFLQKHSVFLLSLVSFYVFVKNKEKAREVLQHITDSTYKACALAEIGESENALQLVDSIVNSSNTLQKKAEPLFRLLDIFASKGNLEYTKKIISRINEIKDFMSVPTDYFLVRAVAASRDFQGAFEIAQKAESYEKFNCYLEIATIQVKNNEIENARNTLSLIPKDVVPYYFDWGFFENGSAMTAVVEQLLIVITKTGYSEGMEKLLGQRKFMDSSYFSFADAYLKNGNVEFSLKILQQTADLDSTHQRKALFHKKIVKYLISERRFDEASKYISDFKENSFPIKDECYSLLAKAYAEQGLKEKAIATHGLIKNPLIAKKTMVAILNSTSEFIKAKEVTETKVEGETPLSLVEMKYAMGRAYLSQIENDPMS